MGPGHREGGTPTAVDSAVPSNFAVTSWGGGDSCPGSGGAPCTGLASPNDSESDFERLRDVGRGTLRAMLAALRFGLGCPALLGPICPAWPPVVNATWERRGRLVDLG